MDPGNGIEDVSMHLLISQRCKTRLSRDLVVSRQKTLLRRFWKTYEYQAPDKELAQWLARDIHDEVWLQSSDRIVQ